MELHTTETPTIPLTTEIPTIPLCMSQLLTTKTPTAQENMSYHCTKGLEMIMSSGIDGKCLYTDKEITEYYRQNLPEQIAVVAISHPILLGDCIRRYVTCIDRAIDYEIPYETFMEYIKHYETHGRQVIINIRKKIKENLIVDRGELYFV